MRRLMSIAAFALLLAVPVWAQRGGAGHAGFSGGHGGGSSGHAGFSGSGHTSSGHIGSSNFSSGMRSGLGFSHGLTQPSRLGSSRGPFLHDGFRGNRFRGGFGHRFHGRGFRNNCFSFGCREVWGLPWIYGGYYDPFWWGDSTSSYDLDYEQNLALANRMNEQSLREQQLRRQEEADADREAYAHSDPAPRPASSGDPQAAPPATQMMPATILVFRDQHQKEIQNYAIVGQTLWNFAPQRREKIPLADLDLAATAKANDDRGVTFRVPTSNEAQ
jgi:hypothetical protein